MVHAHSTKGAFGVEQEPSPLARHPVILIAAVARNGVIGQAGRTPWTLPGDLSHFRHMTLGRPTVMGRRTFESIGRPLPGRPTIVLSADLSFSPKGVILARSLGQAFEAADDLARDAGGTAIMVAGGAVVYAATIDRADRLLLTRVDATPAGDAKFPTVDPRLWTEVENIPAGARSGDTLSYSFTRWERRRASTWLSPRSDMATARL